MVKTFERNLVHIWLKKLGIARRALGSVLSQADRAAGRPAAGFVNRVLGSAQQKKYLALVEAGFRLCRHRILQIKAHFAAYVKLYKIITISSKNFNIFQDFSICFAQFGGTFMKRRRFFAMVRYIIFRNFARFSRTLKEYKLILTRNGCDYCSRLHP